MVSGPKGALGILSGISADELRFAVLSDDVKTISKAPGIGKKTAQKMILELKDKLKLEDAFEIKLAHQQEEDAIDAADLRDSRQEAVEALVALGYSSADALRAVRKVPGGCTGRRCGSNPAGCIEEFLTESSKSPASIAKSNKQWVGTCLYQEYKST